LEYVPELYVEKNNEVPDHLKLSLNKTLTGSFKQQVRFFLFDVDECGRAFYWEV